MDVGTLACRHVRPHRQCLARSLQDRDAAQRLDQSNGLAAVVRTGEQPRRSALFFGGRIVQVDLDDDRHVQRFRPRQRPDLDAWAELYGFPFFRYQGLLIALPHLFYQLDGLRDGEDGEISLAWSHDGENRNRPQLRRPFLGNGPDGGPDDGFLVCQVSPPLRRGDRLWIYYTANPHPHQYPFREPGVPTIRRGTLRVDGWAGMQSRNRTGLLETRPFLLAGPLHVNADCASGELRASLREVTGWAGDEPRTRPPPHGKRILSGFPAKDLR